MKKVAIIGTNGIPANYGGFETLSEYLTKYLREEFFFIVYCSAKKYRKKLAKHNGAKLVYLPLNANGIQSTIYDLISIIHAFFVSDIILILGPTASYILPFNVLFKRKIIINHGGLNEWEREKFNFIEKLFSKLNHGLGAKLADINIADNVKLKESIKKTFDQDSVIIRYGGDHAVESQSIYKFEKKYKDFITEHFYLSISRAQVDNNLHLLIEAFSGTDKILVIVSNWVTTEYGRDLKRRFKNTPNIFLFDAIYDVDELNYLRTMMGVYIHSHSRCGTAPSLVEAMFFKKPIICFDVSQNRETTQNEALYFKDKNELVDKINQIDINQGNKLFEIARKNYTWDIIANEYRELFNN